LFFYSDYELPKDQYHGNLSQDTKKRVSYMEETWEEISGNLTS